MFVNYVLWSKVSGFTNSRLDHRYSNLTKIISPICSVTARGGGGGGGGTPMYVPRDRVCFLRFLVLK